jgi:hypothetical protein
MICFTDACAGLNIGAHKEAAEHLLSALSMQEATGEKSKQLLQTLRRAFLAMVGFSSFQGAQYSHILPTRIARTLQTLRMRMLI